MRFRSFAPIAAAVASLLLAAPRAQANGRFPAAGQIVLDPNDPKHIVVEATYGILVTHDRGASWYWNCEKAVGYTGQEDPYLAIGSTGIVLAASFEGLATSKDECGWSFVGGPLANRFVIDLALAPKGDTGVLVVSNSVSDGVFSTQLYETKDGGANWTQAGTDLPSAFLGLTVEFAPSLPDRVYVSGRYGKPDYPGSIERSDDRGKTWQRFDIPNIAQNLPYIAGIDPANPDVVYVRVDGDPSDQLVVTKDGGKTWKSAFTAKGNLLGFAIAPDGKTVLTGGDSDGIYGADPATLDFKKVSDVGVKCLTWKSDGLYACADEGKDHFTVGLSTDAGKTFTALAHRNQLCGPKPCDPSTNVGNLCPIDWPAVESLVGSQGCGGQGATSASASSSSSSSGGATSGGGCSCASVGHDARAIALPVGALGLLGLLARRARRKRS